MQYIENILYIAEEELVDVIVSQKTYDTMCKTGQLKKLNEGTNNELRLISFMELPQEHQVSVLNHYGNVDDYATKQLIFGKIKEDQMALNFYRDYELPNGNKLPVGNTGQSKSQIDYVVRYTQNAEWLNMIVCLMRDRQTLKKELNVSIMTFWDVVVGMIEDHEVNLPTNPRRLKDKVKKFSSFGYESLIEKHKFGNPYARKVASDIEKEFLIKELVRGKGANNNEIAVAYNSWANRNGYKTITANTVRYRKEEWEKYVAHLQSLDSD